MDCCGPNSPYSPIPLLASLPCYVPHLLLDTGALKTTGGKAEVPSLHKEGWLRPLRKCRGASLAGADGVVRSNSKTISLERTTPVCAQLRWLRVHPSFAKDSCSCMFAEWFCIRRQTRFFDRRLLVRAARQRRRYTVVGSTICGLFLAAQW